MGVDRGSTATRQLMAFSGESAGRHDLRVFLRVLLGVDASAGSGLEGDLNRFFVGRLHPQQENMITTPEEDASDSERKRRELEVGIEGKFRRERPATVAMRITSRRKYGRASTVSARSVLPNPSEGVDRPFL